MLASKALPQSCVTNHQADKSKVGHSRRVKERGSESLSAKARTVTPVHRPRGFLTSSLSILEYSVWREKLAKCSPSDLLVKLNFALP